VHVRTATKAPLAGAFSFVALILLIQTASAGQKPEQVHVTHVVDGDTVVLQDNRVIRLIGINSPELGRDGAPDEPLAQAARAQMQRLVAGRDVTLVHGEEQSDHYGRQLAHLVLADGRDAQEVMLRQGLAALVAIPPNVRWVERYEAAEQDARENRRGLWADPYFTPIPAERVDRARSGFHFVQGHVRKVRETEHDIYLFLSDDFAVMIARSDWHHFLARPSAFRNVRLEASGWLTVHDGHWRLRVHHPAMLRIIGCEAVPALPSVRPDCDPERINGVSPLAGRQTAPSARARDRAVSQSLGTTP
jgi:micrococcal nuclease